MESVDFDIYDKRLVPSEEDWWTPYLNFEVDVAQQKFGGKTISDMMPFVIESPESASIYFVDMPPKPWQYYIRTFVELLRLQRDGRLDYDASGVAWLWLNMVKRDLTGKPQRILPVMVELMRTVEAIGKEPILYGFSESEADSVTRECTDIGDFYEQVKMEKADGSG